MATQPRGIRVVEDSTKRESRIRVERIPDDIHSELSEFCKTRRYSKMFDGLLYCAAIGLKVLKSAESVTVIKGNDCSR